MGRCCERQETTGTRKTYSAFGKFLGFGCIRGQQLEADTVPRLFASYFSTIELQQVHQWEVEDVVVAWPNLSLLRFTWYPAKSKMLPVVSLLHDSEPPTVVSNAIFISAGGFCRQMFAENSKGHKRTMLVPQDSSLISAWYHLFTFFK